jgi:hypothetical protein
MASALDQIEHSFILMMENGAGSAAPDTVRQCDRVPQCDRFDAPA